MIEHKNTYDILFKFIEIKKSHGYKLLLNIIYRKKSTHINHNNIMFNNVCYLQNIFQ